LHTHYRWGLDARQLLLNLRWGLDARQLLLKPCWGLDALKSLFTLTYVGGLMP